MIAEYRRSLKHTDAEELLDLCFYRPLAYLVVRTLHRSRVTPNQVTLCSLIAGLVAAWDFSAGNAWRVAGVWYGLANVLDCADGQLARIQNSGTPLGRLVDGVADYISSIAIFIGIGIGLNAMGMPAWILVIAAGLSSALHSMLFDRYQGEYIARKKGEASYLKQELESYELSLHSTRDPMKRFFMKLYLRYSRLQQRMSRSYDPAMSDQPHMGSVRERVMIRLWSFLGPTTNRTTLILFAVAGRVELFLWTVVLAGNVWLLTCFIVQKVSERQAAQAGVSSKVTSA